MSIFCTWKTAILCSKVNDLRTQRVNKTYRSKINSIQVVLSSKDRTKMSHPRVFQALSDIVSAQETSNRRGAHFVRRYCNLFWTIENPRFGERARRCIAFYGAFYSGVCLTIALLLYLSSSLRAVFLSSYSCCRSDRPFSLAVKEARSSAVQGHGRTSSTIHSLSLSLSAALYTHATSVTLALFRSRCTLVKPRFIMLRI